MVSAASDKINIAIMGVRGRGRNLIGVFCGLNDVNISYFCDVDPGVIPRVAKIVDEAGRPQPKVISDIRRALDDKSIDAIVIATPDHWHAPATILALRRRQGCLRGEARARTICAKAG